MCLAVPGRVIDIRHDGHARLASVDFGTAVRHVDLAFVPEAEVGNWLIVHSGLAVRVMAEEEASTVREMWAHLESQARRG